VRGRTSFALIVLFACAHARADAACVTPEAASHATASITRYFDAEEMKAEPDTAGIRGTAWFLAANLVVTAGHVAEAMKLSSRDWKQLEIAGADIRQSSPARLIQQVGSNAETLAVLELRTAFPSAQSLSIRMEPLVPEEHVASLTYKGDHLRFAEGRFVEYGQADRVAGMALLEMSDGNDRLVLDHGASGAPVIDCEGRVVAAVVSVLTQTMRFQSQVIRVSTPWGSPNVSSVPAQVLRGAQRP